MSSSQTLRQFFTEHTTVDVFSPARGSSHCDGISTYAGGIGDKPPRSQPQGHAGEQNGQRYHQTQGRLQTESANRDTRLGATSGQRRLLGVEVGDYTGHHGPESSTEDVLKEEVNRHRGGPQARVDPVLQRRLDGDEVHEVQQPAGRQQYGRRNNFARGPREAQPQQRSGYQHAAGAEQQASTRESTV